MCLINYFLIVSIIFCLSERGGADYIITLDDDSPAVEGGFITFTVNVYKRDGSRPNEPFKYVWRDSAVLNPHTRETDWIKNTTVSWTIQYPAKFYSYGTYSARVEVYYKNWWGLVSHSSRSELFEISPLLNGNMTIVQSNKTIQSEYLSSDTEAVVDIDLRKGDADYVNKNATEISTFWFVDCKYYGQTNDYTFHYNFSKPNETISVEALIVASYDLPITTTVAPTTTTTTSTTTVKPSNTTVPSNGTTIVSTSTTTTAIPTTEKELPVVTTLKPIPIGANQTVFNSTFPYVCQSSIVPDPNKTYGYFSRKVKVRASIKNIKIEGTNWIKPWDLLSLNVSCNGTGPFYKCLEYHPGHYNITGNETCEDGVRLTSCNFSINRYFLDPNIYTILLLLKNDVGTVIYPVTINIYEVTPKPQLSVIVIPVSCSLAAVVLIVFGISYYIQSRARFTVEVADFDFGQNNPELEYKTFTERLKDSFNSTGYKPLGNPNSTQN